MTQTNGVKLKNKTESENDAKILKEWNRLSCELVDDNYKAGRIKKEAADYRNSGMADFCEETVLICKQKYYDGEEYLSDNGFDRIERYLKLLRPKSKLLAKVGS